MDQPAELAVQLGRRSPFPPLQHRVHTTASLVRPLDAASLFLRPCLRTTVPGLRCVLNPPTGGVGNISTGVVLIAPAMPDAGSIPQMLQLAEPAIPISCFIGPSIPFVPKKILHPTSPQQANSLMRYPLPN